MTRRSRPLRRVTATELCTVLGDPAVRCGRDGRASDLGARPASASTTSLIEIDGPEVPIMDGSAARLRRGDRPGRPRRPGARAASSRSSSRSASRPARPMRSSCPHNGCRFEIEHRLRLPGDRPPEDGARARRRRRSATRSPAPAPSATCATSSVSGRPATRSARRSRTPSSSARRGRQSRRACAIADEFVRHKMLDTIGDLALAGAPISGLTARYKGGHRLNALALHALLQRTMRGRSSSAPSAAARAAGCAVDSTPAPGVAGLRPRGLLTFGWSAAEPSRSGHSVAIIRW